MTGRFRSGSTLLWNCFAKPGDSLRTTNPSTNDDGSTHGPGRSYRLHPPQRVGLLARIRGLDTLGRYYREDWIRRDLLMDELAWDPDLRPYVDTLIDQPSAPALQFNRIDFRLPWFRRHYPNATYIHIYRHPRDQWCSTLMGDVKLFTKDAGMADFPPFDRFYLGMWAQDLKYHFPFLDEGRTGIPTSSFTISGSSLISSASSTAITRSSSRRSSPTRRRDRNLFRGSGPSQSTCRLWKIVVARPLRKWCEYAEAAWFENHEARCEEVLNGFLGRSEGSSA